MHVVFVIALFGDNGGQVELVANLDRLGESGRGSSVRHNLAIVSANHDDTEELFHDGIAGELANDVDVVPLKFGNADNFDFSGESHVFAPMCLTDTLILQSVSARVKPNIKEFRI